MRVIIRIFTQECCLRFVKNHKLFGWASPCATASGQAVVNQARFAVSAMRRPSLTLPLPAGLFQASACQQTIPHPDTGLPSDFRRKPQGLSPAAHSDVSPEMTQRVL